MQIEYETVKERFDIAQASQNRAHDEKEMTNKELERLIEKFDRYKNHYLSKHTASEQISVRTKE